MGKSVKSIIFFLFIFYFNFSTKKKKYNIPDNFIACFKKNFNFKKIPPDLDFDVKFYTLIFLSYSEYIKNTDKKITSFWNNQFRPFLKENYPILKNGIFTTNADQELMINEIDENINSNIIKNNKNINDKEKLLIDEIKMKLIERNKKKNEIIKVNANEKLNKTSINNMPDNKNINNILSKNGSINIKNNLRPHSETLASVSTCDSLSFENNFNFKNNIKEKLKTINNNKINDNINKINDSIYKNNDKINDNGIIYEDINENNNIINEENNINEIINESKNENEEKNKKNILIKNETINYTINKLINNINLNANIIIAPKSKSEIVYKEMTQTFIDKDESCKNITYQALCKTKIKLIDVNLLLKKIVETDFIQKNGEILYAFIRQSFYFINKEIFIKKIINCYEHYNRRNIELYKLSNLIYFLNAYVIQLFLNYKIIPKENNKLLVLIKSFYNKLVAKSINSINLGDIFGDDKNNIIKNEIYEELFKNGNRDCAENNKKLHNKVDRNYIIFTEMKKIEDKQKEKIPQGKNLEEHENNEKIESNNSKEDKNDLNEITNNELIKIIGKEYENLIKNNDFLSEEEKLLYNLKNMLILLNMKTYKESFIINIKRNEIFYKNFSFDLEENEDKAIYTKNKISKIQLINCQTLNNIDIKLNSSNIDTKKYFSVLDWETKQIGEQLINRTKNLLNKIEYKELYGALFTKNAKELNSKNVMENIRKFNNLTMFIIEDILSYDFPKDRAKIIEKWVLIAQYCKNRKDQADCFAIKSALKHYIITGLNLTLKEIKPKIKLIMNEINDYCNLEGNYRVFREEIKNIKKNEFFIPYLGLLLRDITFFEEGGKYLVQGNLINFEKIEKVQNALDSFFKYKKSINRVKFENINELNFFDNLENIKEEYLENIANQLEPEFKLRIMPQKEKRLTQIDNKYFLNDFKRFSCLLISKTMKNSS